MARLVYLSTHGAEDPRRAALLFIAAMGAAAEGHEASVWLACDGVVLMKDHVAKAIHVPGWPPMEELIATAVSDGVAIFVLPEGVEGSVEELDLAGKNASFATAREFARACAAAAQVISI